MTWPRPLNVVFMTNFSDACFRATPSVAQLADDVAIRLTILHVYDPRTQEKHEAQAHVRGFFPEADHYQGTERLAMPGNPVAAVSKLSHRQSIDLVVSPASDPLGLPRLGHRSLRGRVLHECGVPVWSLGRRVDVSKLSRPVRNVACWMEFGSAETTHLALATEYARTVGARLHLLHALPEINEGMILPYAAEQPLHPDGVRDAFHQMMCNTPVKTEIHVQTGGGSRACAALTKACDADLLFTHIPEGPFTNWIRSEFSAVDRCPCPSISVGPSMERHAWKLVRRSVDSRTLSLSA